MKRRLTPSQEHGQVLVEAALTLLMFLVFLFAVMESGRVLQVQQVLTDGAREGARLSVAPLTGTSNLAPVAEVKSEVEKYLKWASIDPAKATINVDQGVILAGNPTRFTRVTVTLPYEIMTIGMFSDLNVTLTGSSLMRNETSP